MKTLAVIPARGGSKGIARKNIKPLGGRPLIAWTIEAAARAKHVDRAIVSTEDEEIARVARTCGGDVPFLRPARLAQDDSPGIDPVLHALEELPGFDAVVLLQPTSPLRLASDVDACVELAHASNAPAAVSVAACEEHPYWMYHVDAARRLTPVVDRPLVTRRQDLPPVFTLNGAVYFARTAFLTQARTFLTPDTVGYVMPRERSLDLDTHLDWDMAELVLGRRQ